MAHSATRGSVVNNPAESSNGLGKNKSKGKKSMYLSIKYVEHYQWQTPEHGSSKTVINTVDSSACLPPASGARLITGFC